MDTSRYEAAVERNLALLTTENIAMNRTRRRTIGFAAFAGLVLVSGGSQWVGAFALVKARGMLEERLKPLGYAVSWKEFPGGPQLLEGLKVGDVDFAHSGEAPPIFAQAAGAPLLSIG